MGKTYKCRYRFCSHENSEILEGDEIKEGRVYYHKDCYQTKRNILAIIDLWAKEVDKNVVYSHLQKTIHTLVFDKHVNSGIILFGLRYYIDHKIPLRYPGGLYYVVKNRDVEREWNKLQTKDKIKFVFDEVDAIEEDKIKFSYKPKKKRSGFDDILC